MKVWKSEFKTGEKLPTTSLPLWSRILRLLGFVKDVGFVYDKDNKKWIEITK